MKIDKKALALILGLLANIVATVSADASGKVNEKQQSAAIAFSACTFGMLSIDYFSVRVSSALDLGLMYRLDEESLLTEKSSSVLTEVGRIGYQNSVQGFTIASTLDSRWQNLPNLFETTMQKGIKKWNSGATLGVSQKTARAGTFSQILALCNIAKTQVVDDAKKNKMSIKTWVITAGGELLPPLNPGAK